VPAVFCVYAALFGWAMSSGYGKTVAYVLLAFIGLSAITAVANVAWILISPARRRQLSRSPHRPTDVDDAAP
jgi:hypothetical protein